MRQFRLLTALLSFLLAAAGTLSAQTATGTVTGTVRDASGSVVPNVKVTITGKDTGFSREATTTDSGDYSFTLLPVGVYSVSAEQKGFSTAQQSGIQLNVDQVARVDLNLAVGSTSETVTVEAASVEIDSETSSVGQVVSERQVTQLPLNGRSFLDLLFLGAGAVSPPNGEQGSMRQGEGGAISINGSRPTSNNYLLDGMVNTDTALNTPAVVLSVDAIQEFKEQTATYSAEYGFSANQINIISKGGTNDFHGALFEFDRNNFFDARSFFQAGSAPLRQNQFGFVATGPIWIPKLYNGKNKTFFMANYEGQRTRQGIDQFYLVPTPAQLSGHFTSTIIDPTTGAPFLNNTIPTSRFSNLANLAVQKFFPTPNVNLPQGNYRLATSLPNDVDQQTYRIDQNLGKFGTVFARGTRSSFSVNSIGNVAPNPPLGENFFVEDTTNWAVSHTLTIGATKVNQFRFGYLGATANQAGFPADPADVSALGLTGVFTGLSPGQRVYPSLQFSNGGFSTVGGSINAYETSNQPMWDFADSFTWVRGNHTIGIGAEYRQWKLERDLADNFLGNFTFNGFATTPSSLAAPTGDNVIADTLLGYYSGAAVFQPGGLTTGVTGNPRTFNLKYLGPYVQDDWKVNQRLTLNLGVRWDFRTVPYETDNHMGWLDVTNPAGGLCVADKTLVTKGIVGNGSYYRYCGRDNPADASLTPFAPRIGFAYRPFGGDKTVVRGGYGIFWDSAELRETDGSADIYPYDSRGNYVQSSGQTAPLQTTNRLFPPIAGGVAVPADNTFIAVIISEHPRSPYVQQWTFSIERQLTPKTTLELNYIGNKGTHLLERRNINQAYAPANPSNPAPLASRRPYPNFVTYIDSDWSGNSSYNSGNAKIEHRSGSLGLTGVYTWAKAIDTKSAAAGIGQTGSGYQGFMDNHDAALDRGLADFDVDHRVVGSFVYELPFGRGKRFLSSTPKAADIVLGNWQLNGIATFQKGFPYSISAADTGNLLDSNGAQRASVVGNPNPSGFKQSIAQWFNTGAFVQPAAGVYGTSGRNILRAPGINSWNLSLFKNFPFKERVNLQLRLESFNTFNHTQWGVPNHDVTSPQFGQITTTNVDGRINQLGGKLTW